MKTGKPLKARQLNALQLLAVGTPMVQVAERLEVSVMTVYRWRRQPEFEAKLNAITSSGLEEIAKQLNATALTAIESVQDVLCDMAQPAAIRVRAALGILNAMGSVNGALEKGLRHRVADFDLAHRFSNHGFTFDRGGRPCNPRREPSNTSEDTVITI